MVCALCLLLFVDVLSLRNCTVAQFAIVSDGVSIAEVNSTLSKCVVMTVTPLSASLGIEVVVSLFTMDGTGIHGYCFAGLYMVELDHFLFSHAPVL